MKLPKYKIVFETKDFTAFYDTNKEKDFEQFIHLYNQSPRGTTIKIYAKEDLTYQLIYKEDNNKIGF